MASVVEHDVLFTVRDSTDPSVVDSMVTHLRSLSFLPGVAHLSAGPLLRRRSAAATPFIHLLHSRYAFKDDLASYAADPAYLAVVRDRVIPICDDIVALDWVADGVAPAPVPVPLGSAARLTLAKLNERAAPGEVLEAMAAVRAKGYEVSYGENFSPVRAQGYSLGFLAVFPSVEAIDAIEGVEAEALKEKVRPLLKSVVGAVPASLIGRRRRAYFKGDPRRPRLTRCLWEKKEKKDEKKRGDRKMYKGILVS